MGVAVVIDARIVGRMIAGLGAAGGVLALLPVPTFPLWVGRLVCREVSLALAVLALAGLAVGRDRISGLLALVACGTVLATTLPLVRLCVARRVPLSALEYVSGVRTPAVEVRRDLALDAGGTLLCDRYRGAGAGARPFVLVVHGGSWQRGDKGEVAHVSRALAASGLTVFDLRYRLAPEHPFPAAVDDVRSAHSYIASHAAELGVDPERAAYLGRSAGGQVALVAAYTPDGPPVARVISLYAPTDLAWSHGHPFFPDVVDGSRSIEVYLGGAPDAVPDRYSEATPQSRADGGARLPPTLVIHGTADRLVRDANAKMLAAELARAGQRCELLLVPGAEHGFDVRPGGLGEQLARHEILRFLAGM